MFRKSQVKKGINLRNTTDIIHDHIKNNFISKQQWVRALGAKNFRPRMVTDRQDKFTNLHMIEFNINGI